MATHLLTLKGNYIWLDDLVNDKRYEGLAKEVLVRSDLDVSTVFYFDGLNQFDKNTGIDFTDIDVNGNGAFGTLAEWQDWYTANTGNFNGGGSAPKTYRALVTQVNTDAPTAIVLENTFGEELVWTYFDTGKYILTSANGNFVEGKTFIFTGKIYNTPTRCDFVYNVTDNAPNGVMFQTALDGVFSDSLLINTEVQILVYP